MISASTAFTQFDRTAAFFYWTVIAIASAITAVIFVQLAQTLYEWLRMWWYLREVPKLKPKHSFSLLIDMYKQMAAMDPGLGIKVKSFKYLQGVFKSIEDQDVTVAFYGPYPFLAACTPETVESVLTNAENVDRSFFYAMMEPWVGGGMLTLSGEAWKSRRKIVRPGYHFRILDGYVPIFNKRGERLMKKLASMAGGFFDVMPVVRAATLGAVLETTMGVDFDEEIERVGYLKIHDALSDAVTKRAAKFHYWFDSIYAFTRECKEMKRNVEKAKAFLDTILKKRLADYKNGVRDPISSNVFLEILLRMWVDEGTLTETEVRDECMAMLIGGFDPTANNIAHALHLLGLHPEIQAKVHEEIDLVCGEDWYKPVTTDELKELTYMESVLKETLRLYPPVPIISRKLTTDIAIGKYTIPRGTVGFVAIYFLQRNPRFFEDPDAFKPERFLETKSTPNYAFAAFSCGPRNCLGQKFSILQAKIFMTYVLRRFEVTSKIPMDELVLTTDIILKPMQGLEIELTPRRHP
ncbi:cytochrome P450 4V2-like isoform X1 [Haemaphysalis longicornis]